MNGQLVESAAPKLLPVVLTAPLVFAMAEALFAYKQGLDHVYLFHQNVLVFSPLMVIAILVAFGKMTLKRGVLCLPLFLILALGHPGYMVAKRQESTSLCARQLKTVGLAANQYRFDGANQYPETPQALSPKYLKTAPVCPYSGEPYIWQSSPGTGDREPNLTVQCLGGGHTVYDENSDIVYTDLKYRSGSGEVTDLRGGRH